METVSYGAVQCCIECRQAAAVAMGERELTVLCYNDISTALGPDIGGAK